MKNKFLLSALIVVLAGSAVYAAPNFEYSQNAPATTYQQPNYSLPTQAVNSNQTLKGRVVTVPAGEHISAVVTTPISSATMTTGQNVTMALGTDFYYGGNLVAPAGSSVTGTVVEVSSAKHGNLNAKLLLRFTQIITPYGVQIPISAVVKTDDNSGVLKGGTGADVAKEYGKDIAVGAAAGALAGVIISPLAGGSIGRGTALATAVGAGGGVIKGIWDKGSEIEIPVNSSVQLVLTQPITVNPSVYNEN